MKNHRIFLIIILIILILAIFYIFLIIKNVSTNSTTETQTSLKMTNQPAIDENIASSAQSKNSKEQNQKITEHINNIINTNQYGKCGVYVKNIKTGEEITINENEEFFPASIYKLPLAVLILKDIDDKKVSFDDNYIVNYSHIAYSYDALASKIGSSVSVRYLLESLIRNSDNTAQKLLTTEIIGGYENFNKRIIEDLKIDGFQGNFENLSVTPREVGTLLENIYHKKYLSGVSNEYLLELLSSTSSSFDDRIVIGVPDDTRVAHKIGQLDDIYQDAGIVYGDEDYIIVLMNEKIMSYDMASKKISDISNLIWNYFN